MKKLLLCIASLVEILVVGDGYSSNLSSSPSPIINSPFPNHNSPSPIINSSSPIINSSSPIINSPFPNHNSSTPRLSLPASSAIDVVRLQTPAPTGTATTPYIILPGTKEHVVWSSGRQNKLSHTLRDGYFVISSTPNEQLKQARKIGEALLPEFVIFAREEDHGGSREVVIDVVSASECAPDSLPSMRSLVLGDIICMHSDTLLNLPSKLRPGSSVEFFVRKYNNTANGNYFYAPTDLHFYLPSHISSSSSSLSSSLTPHPLSISMATPNLRSVSLDPGSAPTADLSLSGIASLESLFGRFLSFPPASASVLMPLAPVAARADTADSLTNAGTSLTPVEEPPRIDFNLLETTTVAAPTTHAAETPDPSFGSASSGEGTSVDTVATGTNASSTSTEK